VLAQRYAWAVILWLVASVAVVPVAYATDQVTVPTTVGQTVTLSWQGTAGTGVNSGSDCSASPIGSDTHDVGVTVPTGAYALASVEMKVTITFSGESDLILTIVRPDGTSVAADNGSVGESETASTSNPPQGTYHFIVCPFVAAAPQAYSATMTITASAPPPPALASCDAPGKALTFSKPIYVDTTRAGGEPSVVAHPNGTLMYAAHAGTTHFYSLEVDNPTSTAFFDNYRGQVYAWYSTDNGANWNYVDRTLPPDNAPGTGFSDPDFAIDAAGNVYLSEINLANVAISKSTTAGKSYSLQNFFAEDITDRQWSTAGPANVVFIDGNPQEEGGTIPTEPIGNTDHTIYRSTDGGKTFSVGADDAGGAGDIVYDPVRKTVYEAHFGGSLQMAAFRHSLDADATTALTPDLSTVAPGVSMLSHWPALDVDAKGNVYVVWDETGTGARAAGVWYAYSTDGAHTWSQPVRVDKNDNTKIWPWIAVGDTGRVAIAWFGTDRTLPDNDAEQAGSGDPWNLYVAQTLNGLGCTGSPVPGFRVSRATPDPLHIGQICMGGTICQAELVDRRLGDYFTIDIDTTGNLVAAYSDTRQGGAVALPGFVRQSGGTNFFKGKPAKNR
jgi:hypothetical protein